jgi:hypothetical protein
VHKVEEKRTWGSEILIGCTKLQTVSPKKLLHLSLDNDGPHNSVMKARSPNVLPPVCIVCEKQSDLFVIDDMSYIVIIWYIFIIKWNHYTVASK